MGTNSSQVQSLPKFEWNWIGNQTGIDLFKRTSDSLVAERRLISLDHSFPLNTELEIYQFRSKNNFGLVKVYQVDGVEEREKKNTSTCGCSEATLLSVFSERIQFRLSDLPQLTFPESLYLLRQAVNSFHHLYQRFGPLHVNSQLIGVNDESKIRVWVNENWALNHPSHKIPVLLTINNLHLPPELRDEREMVTNILQVVEEKTQHGRYPPQFADAVYLNAVNFRELKRFLAKFMAHDYQDYIPEIIKRSRVLASQSQISHYQNASSPSFSQPTPNLKIVQSMYQQFNNPPQYSAQLTKTNSTPSEPAQFQNAFSNNKYNPGYIVEKRRVQSLPFQSKTVFSFNQNNFPNHQNNLPTTTTIPQHSFIPFTSNPIPFNHSNPPPSSTHLPSNQPTNNFQYLKFKLIDDDKPTATIPQAHFNRQPVNAGVIGGDQAEEHFQKIRLMLKPDSIQSSEHKAVYKIVQGRSTAESAQKVR